MATDLDWRQHTQNQHLNFHRHTARSTVYFAPRSPLHQGATDVPSLPTPHIAPRPRRPHSIHIVSYPSGFVPLDLRPELLGSVEPPRRSKSSAQRLSGVLDGKHRQRSERRGTSEDAGKNSVDRGHNALDSLRSFLRRSGPAPNSAKQISPPDRPAATPRLRDRPSIQERPLSWVSTASRTSRADLDNIATVLRPAVADMSTRTPLVTGGTLSTVASFNTSSSSSFRAATKNLVNASVHEISNSRPVAASNGMSCEIRLAEPNVFLTGFDHDGVVRHESHNSSAMLRGKLYLNVTKNTKIRAVEITFSGRTHSDWPEGIPPTKTEVVEEETLRKQTLTFFRATNPIWETEYGDQCVYKLKGSASPSLSRLASEASESSTSLHLRNKSRDSVSAKELRRLTLSAAQSRSFGKSDSPNASQGKAFKVFYPGTYEYSFEMPIDHHQVETVKLQYAWVKWEVQANIERAGAFKANLHGTKEVSVVRVPDQLSLEMTEPISISRDWEDQLHYDIMISGKSFPIGGQIPIAFKLTPLAKVRLHKIKIFVTESLEYWTNSHRVTRKDPGRKILLLEKCARKPLDQQYSNSRFEVLSGGELSLDEYQRAYVASQGRRRFQAYKRGEEPGPDAAPVDNMLGELDLGLEQYWGSTEMEIDVQIPTCSMMAKDRNLVLHPTCSWKNVNVFHWIKIVMRISRLDPEDPAGKKRRHFEISIDSPFTVLNCRATRANTALPMYQSPEDFRQPSQPCCGCPDAKSRNVSPTSSTNDLPDAVPVTSKPESPIISPAMPAPPQAAHVHNGNNGPMTPTNGISVTSTSRPASIIGPSSLANPINRVREQDAPARPIHLLRYPSFDPPAFGDDTAPPALPQPTPPPNYDVIVGTPSVDGLADYFARLAEHEHPSEDEASTPSPPTNNNGNGDSPPTNGGGEYFTIGTSTAPVSDNVIADESNQDTETESSDEDDHRPRRVVSRGGGVNVVNPRTPGGRRGPSRSLDLGRPTAEEFALSMPKIVRRVVAEGTVN